MNNKGLRYYFFAIAVILGFIITVQLKSNIAYQGIVTITDLVDMQNEIQNYENENKDISESANQVIAKYEEYRKNLNNSGDISATMRKELEKVKSYSDYEKVSGPGIIIT